MQLSLEKTLSVKIESVKMLMFITFSTLFFMALTIHIAFSGRVFYNEFGHHLEFAQRMEESGRILLPHFSFHAMTIAVHQVVVSIAPSLALGSDDPYVDNSWLVSCLIVLGVVCALTIFLLKRYLARTIRSDYLAMAIAFSLLIVQPIFAFAPIDHRYYLGYFTPNIYVIPTQTLLKLTTIALFMMTPLLFKKGVSWLTIALVMVLVIANGLSKPNYLILMMPALIIMASIEIYKKRQINYAVFAAMLVSGATVLVWQFIFKFINAENLIYQSSIAVTKPFDVLSTLSDYAPEKIILSIVFPLYVVIAFRREASKDREIIFSWILFLLGASYAIFLAETGPAKYSGNFLWSPQIANFVLFAASARFLFTRIPQDFAKLDRRTAAAVSIFAIHLLCGIFYYVRSFTHTFA
jgi:hypothetical protein